MVKKSELTCAICNQKESFEDLVELRQNGWLVVGWNIDKNIPVCYCRLCLGKTNGENAATKNRRSKKKYKN